MPHQIYSNSAVVTSFCKFNVAHETSRKSISFMWKLSDSCFSVFHSSYVLLKNHHFIEICSLKSRLKSTHFFFGQFYASSSVLIHDFLRVKQIIIYELSGFTEYLTFRLIIEWLVFYFLQKIFTVKKIFEGIDDRIVNINRFLAISESYG